MHECGEMRYETCNVYWQDDRFTREILNIFTYGMITGNCLVIIIIPLTLSVVDISDKLLCSML